MLLILRQHMSLTNYNQQALRVLGILCFGLVIVSGCKRPLRIVQNTSALPGMSERVRVSSGEVDAAEPAIAAAPDGSVYVAWVEHGTKSQADVEIARFNRDGEMQGSAVRVNSQAGTATAWRGDPPTVAVAPDQTVFVGWTARVESRSGQATELYLSSSRDHGQTFGAPVRVNDDQRPAVHGMHSLAIGNDGHLYIAWLDERNITPMPMKDMKSEANSKGRHMESNREVFISSSTDGGRTFTTNQRVATDVCPCCKTALAIGPEGRVHLSWRQVLPGDFRHIAVATSVDGGKLFAKPVIVSDDHWVLKGCPVSGASVSAAAEGKLRVLWYAGGEKGEHGIYWSESQDGGQTFSQRQLIAATNAHGTPVLLNDRDGTSTAVWEAGENGVTHVIAVRIPTKASVASDQNNAGIGELPAAVTTSDRLFIVDLVKQGAKQSIWLVTAPKPV